MKNSHGLSMSPALLVPPPTMVAPYWLAVVGIPVPTLKTPRKLYAVVPVPTVTAAEP
jgi:hypothetical protein